jgi:tetratricopeptide (TPR) repeat protein
MRNPPLIVVASITVLLGFGSSGFVQAQDRPAQSDSGQAAPDAPQPQKKPAAKTQSSQGASSPDSSAPPTQPAEDKPATKPSATDENAFPEAVSREAAKAAGNPAASGESSGSDAPANTKHPTADDNPFPEDVSRNAAKAAGNSPDQNPDQTPDQTQAPKRDLPPGVSSSQSDSGLSLPGSEPSAPMNDPVRAKKDIDVGEFYLKKGDYQGALLRYKEATTYDPTNVDAIFGLAETQQMLKNNAEAARNYQLYLDVVPSGPRAKQALKALKTLQAGK